MAKPRVLVTYRLPASALVPLEEVADVEVFTDGVLTADQLRQRIAFKQGVVVAALDAINKDVIDAANDLKVIANVAVGFNNIDVPYAKSKGIVVTNTPDVLSEATATMTIGLILATTRRIVEGDRIVRSGRWHRFALDFMVGDDIKDRQLGIVGAGRIGQLVAQRAQTFGMKIAYFDPAPRSLPYASMALPELLATSDVITVHVPLLPETRHLMNRDAFSQMKTSAYFINTSRGPVVDEDALVWALSSGVIKGAGLDVYENEPHVHQGLLTMENVVILPHMGSATADTRSAMYDLAVRNAANILSGGNPITPV